jgi:hypothetical protein
VVTSSTALYHVATRRPSSNERLQLSNGNIPQRAAVQQTMQSEEQIELRTRERVTNQSCLLLRLYQAELARDPASRATESSRSNLIALRHTIAQIYGNAEPSVMASQEQMNSLSAQRCAG